MNLLAQFGWAGFAILAVILLLRELKPILERRNGKNGLQVLNGAPNAGQMPKEYWLLEMREALMDGLKPTNELLGQMVHIQEEIRDLQRDHVSELKMLKEEIVRSGRRLSGGHA